MLVRTTGRERETGYLTAVGRGSGDEVWSAEVATGASLGIAKSGATATSGGVVVAGGAESLSGYDVATGEEQFTVPVGVEDGVPGASIVPDEDGVVVSTAEGGLLALDAAGEVRWRSEVPVEPPISAGLTTVAGVERADDGATVTALVGVRADSGAERWRAPLDMRDPPGLAVDGDRVHVAGERLRTFDAGDGEPRGEFDFGDDERAATPPVFGDGSAFYVGTGVRSPGPDYGTVYPFGTAIPYEYRTEDTARDLAIGGPETYYVAVGTEVHAVNPRTVTADWRVEVTASRLAADDGGCFATTRGEDARLVALDAPDRA